MFDSSLSSSSALHQTVKKMEQLVSSSMGFTRFLERSAFLPARRKSVFKREVESKTDCCSKERPKWRVARLQISRQHVHRRHPVDGGLWLGIGTQCDVYWRHGTWYSEILGDRLGVCSGGGVTEVVCLCNVRWLGKSE